MACLLFTSVGCSQESKEALFEEGKGALREENFQGAIVLFKFALEKDPNFSAARLELGRAYLESGKIEQAERAFNKYRHQNPYDEEVLPEVARIHMIRGKAAEAIVTIDEYLEKHPDSGDAMELKALSLAMLQDFEQAQVFFEKIILADSSRTSAYNGLANVLWTRGKKSEARKVVNELLSRFPENRKGLHLLAYIESISGNHEEAYVAYERVIKAHPQDIVARYKVGKWHISKKDYEKSESIGRALTNEFPNSPHGYMLIGMGQFFDKNYMNAISSLQKAAKLGGDVETYFYLGLSLYSTGDLETAVSQFRLAVESAPDFSKAREMLSLVLLQQGRFEESAVEAQKAVASNQDSSVGRHLLARSYLAGGQRDKALATYDQLTEFNPGSVSAHYQKGLLHFQEGHFDQAELSLRDALQVAPDSVQPRILLSSFYLRREDRDMAAQVLEDGLSGTPGDAVLYCLMARIKLLEKEHDAAKKYLGQAKESDPANVMAYFDSASILVSDKAFEKAIAEYDGVLKHHPKNPKAWLEKGMTLDVLGRKQDAESCFVEAKKYGVAKEYAAIASSRLHMGLYNEALVDLNEALALWPSNLLLLDMKGDLLLRTGHHKEMLALCKALYAVHPMKGLDLEIGTYLLMEDYDNALASAERLKNKYPDIPVGYVASSNVLTESGNQKAAEDVLHEGLEHCGPVPTMLLALGNYYGSLGDRDKAFAYLDSAIKRQSDFAAAYTARGTVYERNGQLDKAVDEYRIALGITNKDVIALNNLAVIYTDMPEKSRDALRLAFIAYTRAPWNPRVLDTLGYAMLKNGKVEESVDILQKAVQLSADEPTMRYHLGQAYYQQGKNDEAAAELRFALDMPSFDQSEEAKQLLNTINGG